MKLIYIFSLLILSFVISCQKKNKKNTAKNDTIVVAEKNETAAVTDHQNADSAAVVFDEYENPRIQKYMELLNQSILDNLPKDQIVSEDDFEGIYEGNNKIGSFIDRDGKIYEGTIINKERNWRPLKGEGKIIYPNQIILIANFENFCDGTSWGVDGKVYFPNGDYFVGCIKWHDLIPMTGTLYQGDQEFTYVNGKKIPR
jgi:hypothetical protein